MSWHQLSKDYAIEVLVSDTPTGKHLTIDTQWFGAKNPQALQRQYSVTLPPDVLKRIGQYLTQRSKT
jgi:hypothetical protein